MTDEDFYTQVFSNRDTLARVLLVSLTDNDVFGELKSGREFSSNAILSFHQIVFNCDPDPLITLSACYARKTDSELQVALPMIMLFPDAIIKHEHRPIILTDPSSYYYNEEYFCEGLEYEYISYGDHEGLALPQRTALRIYDFHNLKLQYSVLLQEIRRMALDVSSYLENQGFKEYGRK